MRVRMIELRLLGIVLTGLWVAAFVLVVLGYHPGGPLDLLVGIAAVGPVAVALAAVKWPPVARGRRAFASIAWLGLVAILVLVPSLAGVVTQLSGRGPQTLLPSFEAVYPWAIGLIATSWFAGLGVARRRLGETAFRRPRLVMGSVLGLAFAVLSSAPFATASVVNELALEGQPASSSRFGPTDPALPLPTCTDPLTAGSTAHLDLSMDAAVDGRPTGQVTVAGGRNGANVRWLGFAATRLTIGLEGVTRIGDRAWVTHAGGAWRSAAAAEVTGRDLDRQLVAVALGPENRIAAEDRGVGYIEGARARQCRMPVDGLTLREALPEIDLLVGSVDVSRWRGDIDFWMFADGELGQANGRLNGPAIGLGQDSVLATIRFQLTATDRGQPVTVFPPTS